MNGSGKYWVISVGINAFITCALLTFSWFFRVIDKSIATMVVGATLAYWLRESSAHGRTLATSITRDQDLREKEATKDA